MFGRTELTLFTDDGAQEAEQDNEYEAFLCILRDISERKRADEELRKHRDHLQELVDERTGNCWWQWKRRSRRIALI